MRDRILAVIVSACVGGALPLAPGIISSAAAQAAGQLCEAAGQGPACIGAFTKTPMGGGGGMGGIGAAGAAVGLGLMFLDLLDSTNNAQPQAPAAAASGASPAMIGGVTTYGPGSPATTTLITDGQRSALLDQLRPLGDSGNPSAPADPVQMQKTALLGTLRPLGNFSNPGDGSGPHSAADQLCIAAGEAPGCIGKFVPHAAGTPAADASLLPTPQSARDFQTALNAVQALPALPARSSSQPCAAVVGFAVSDDGVETQTTSCDAPAQALSALNGTDEALSELARVPFDTAANMSGAAPPVIIDNPNAKVALLRPAVVTGDALDREIREVERDTCAKLVDLQKKLVGFENAMTRLKTSAPMIAAEHQEWVKQERGAYQGLAKDFADIMINRLDAQYDKEIEELDKKARQAINMRKNAIRPEYRDTFDAFFRQYFRQWEAAKLKQEFVTGLLDKFSKGIDLADWLDSEDEYEKRTMLVEFVLTNPVLVTPEIAAVTGLSDSLINAGLHGFQAWESASVLATLDSASDRYQRGLMTLELKIDQTNRDIAKAKTEAARAKRQCPAA
jgi:hypothetical protein